MTRIIARNSAPMRMNNPAALTNARIRNSTECTGLFEAITMNAAAMHTPAKREKKTAGRIMRMSPRTGPPPRTTRNAGRSRPRAASGLQRGAIGCCRVSCPSPIRRIERDVLGDLALPAVAVRKQALLVEVELLARLGGELEVRAFDDGVHRAGLLAKAAVDAFDHIDVVARGAAGAVVAARSGFDRDGLRRADRLAEFTGDAAFLT